MKIFQTTVFFGFLSISNLLFSQSTDYETLSSEEDQAGKYKSYTASNDVTYSIGDTLYFTEPSSENGTYISSQKMDITAKPVPFDSAENGKYSVIQTIKVSGSLEQGYMVGFITKGELIDANYLIFIEYGIESQEIKQ